MSALKIVARVFLNHFHEGGRKLDIDTVKQNLKFVLPIYSHDDQDHSHQDNTEELLVFIRAIKAWLGEADDVSFCPERLCLALDPIKLEIFSKNLGLDITQTTPALIATLTSLIYSSEFDEPFSHPAVTGNSYRQYITDLI